MDSRGKVVRVAGSGLPHPVDTRIAGHGASRSNPRRAVFVHSPHRAPGVPKNIFVGRLLSHPSDVGDVVRVRFESVRDYAGPAGPIDRAFEIQNIVDSGEGLDLELFGSTANATVQSPTTAATALPDAFYNSQGMNLTSALTIVADVVQAGTYNLAGHADLNNAAAIFYYLGNLTIADGAIINITGNAQLRIRGFLQINGDIVGQGGGLAGVADLGGSLLVTNGGEQHEPAVFNTIAGNPGFVGNSRGMDGIQSRQVRLGNMFHTMPAALVVGKHASAPILSLVVSGNSLLGLPTDLRGSGGAPGGRIAEFQGGGLSEETLGGPGAAGGAGLCIICRGMALGASGSINLNGNDSVATSLNTEIGGGEYDGYPGTGGAGGPGTMYILLDGAGLSVPGIGTNNFSARCGVVPVNGTPLPMRNHNLPSSFFLFQPLVGYMDESFISAADLFNGAQRVVYRVP